MRATGIFEFIDRDWPVRNSMFGQELSDIDYIVGMIGVHTMPGIMSGSTLSACAERRKPYR